MAEGMTPEAIAWRDAARSYRSRLVEVCRRIGLDAGDDMLLPDQRAILAALVRRVDTVPRECMERRLAKRQRQIDESHEALRRKNQSIAGLEVYNRSLRAQIEGMSSAVGMLSSVLTWMREELGIGDAESADLDDMMAELSDRLLPPGLTWPRFDDGMRLRFGDELPEFADTIYRDAQTVKFLANGTVEITSAGGSANRYVVLYPGERVERPAPKVLDADGAEIRVGDTVWHVETGEQCRVVEVDSRSVSVDFCADGDGIKHTGSVLPVNLTHRAPVLAADGRQLREGETVWVTKDSPCDAPLDKGDEVTVRRAYPKTVSVEDEVGESWIVYADHLTHERPDSFELIEQDVELCPHHYAQKYNKPSGMSNAKFQRTDLVRRAKALAGGA